MRPSGPLLKSVDGLKKSNLNLEHCQTIQNFHCAGQYLRIIAEKFLSCKSIGGSVHSRKVDVVVSFDGGCTQRK